MLEPEEKAAGRLFRDRSQAALKESLWTDPPGFVVPTFIAIYRHACDRRDGRSTALELHEIYRPSPRLTVETDTSGRHLAFFYDEWTPNDVDLWQIPAGRFGFVFKEGKCRLCVRTARSRVGRLVDAWLRPPLQERAHR